MNAVPVLLDVRDLHVTYPSGGGVPAVRGVSFHLERGETLGVAGESGCGKSTLAGALLRLLPAGTEVSGEVLLDGQDVLKMREDRLRAVRWTELAVVFQGALHTLNPVKRIGWQIEEAVTTHERGVPRSELHARVRELLETVGIPGRRAADYPHQLSGGQRQRVLIALALACSPHLLIADEPTTALDVMVQAQVLRLLEDLQRDRFHHTRSLDPRLGLPAAGGDVRRPDRRGRAERRGLRIAEAPVHRRARGRVPHHRRPAVSYGPVWAAW